MKKVSLVVVGAGARGNAYANYTKDFPEEAEIVAVCDPHDNRLKQFSENFNIPDNMQFKDWHEILNMPKLADAACICTQDAGHKAPAVALAAKGYNLLLEKPMAPTLEDCTAIYAAAKNAGIMLAVCHVLRYAGFNKKLKETIESGVIGNIRNIQLLEPVGYWHYAHSYVRGNWRKEEESSSMLLAKSCHDIDLLNYLIPSKCKKVSSYGALSYFTKSNQPLGAADRCTACPMDIESKCAYSALKIYLRDRKNDLNTWPVDVVSPKGTPEAVLEALKTGPYGRCVFASDNDVVDHQVVNLEFEDGATASFTMCAFTFSDSRELYIMGDKGALRCVNKNITHYDFLTDVEKKVPYNIDTTASSGHGGGDSGLMRSFVTAIRENDPSYITSGPDVSLESHLIVFAAEKSRRNCTMETLDFGLQD